MLTIVCVRGSAAGELDPETPQRALEHVQQILTADGVFSAQLVEPLTALARSQQESGDHALALVALERAIQVLRVNQGLHTLLQVPLLKLELHSEEARGNDAGVWKLEQALLALARRHADDVPAAAVFAEIADRQMRALSEYMDGGSPPELVFGCFYKQWPNSPAGSCTAGSRKIVVQGMLAEAQRNYAAAIGVLLRNGRYADAELKELEMKLLYGVDLVRALHSDDKSAQPVPLVPAYVRSAQVEPWRSRIAPVAALASWQPPQEDSMGAAPDGQTAPPHAHMMSPYHRGWQSLRRLYLYSTATSRPALEQGEALTQIADWELLYSHNGVALASYEQARVMLERAAVPDTEIRRLFAPATPVILPAFRPNPLARRADRPVTGHIDVEFAITKYGRGRAVEIVDVVNATANDVDRLVAIVKSSRFRPRLTDDGFAAAPVAMRYYVHSAGDEPSMQ